MKRTLLCLSLLIITGTAAYASDHTNLDENLPTELQDAYATPFRNREVQGVVRYIDEDPGNRFVYQPRFEFGVLPNTEFTVQGTFYSGNTDRTGSGDVSAEVLYNFNTESLYLPAFALAVNADFPTGERSAGVDVTTKVILSKMPYVRTTWLHRLHANLIWKRNAGRDRATERHVQFKGIIGFSCRAGKDQSLVLDYVREQKEKKHEESNVVEAGLRRQLTPYTIGSIGAGAGFGDASERYRVTIGVQHSF
ncbi:transporter [Geomonas oryzisoli]|uniref:Transporter n=1 Tax=Geomonas oryzisoli TaxID=2847992 RepID=A0ABX8J8D7_9BACT|nr:transporter [Geomonas oryzisoli]QWV92964.1 transporter [Geomonas oryzisoli]